MKKLIFTLVFVLIMGLSFTSCTKHEFKDFQTVQKENFTNNFNNTFNVSTDQYKNHDWGFNDQIKVYDYTQHTTTRGVNVNGNMWYKEWKRPVNVTESEKQKVVAEFSKVREGATHTENLPWENYWVQQVYQGTNPSVDGTGTKVYPNNVMNQLIAYNFNKNEYEHVNNFNNANNTTEYTDDVTHEKFIGTTLMIDMGSGDVDNQFGYHNTSSSAYYYDYIILEIDGSYYVGFDIVGYHPVGQDANANMDVNRDWIFNDWIVKISPAEFNMDGAVRIIAEDLGVAISDFDYNDVVFDAKVANIWDGSLNKNVLVAYITIQAAGGTLPLTVAGKEVHELFGVTTSTMVNTNNGTVSKNPISFKAILGDANWNVNGADVVKSIPVLVKTDKGIITLDLETGKAPEKIAVKTTFKWCDERQPINIKYPLFSDWVLNKAVIWN
jgi:hypothetical protein